MTSYAPMEDNEVAYTMQPPLLPYTHTYADEVSVGMRRKKFQLTNAEKIIAAFGSAVLLILAYAILFREKNNFYNEIESDEDSNILLAKKKNTHHSINPLTSCMHPDFRDHTLKLAYEQTYFSLLGDVKGEKKFEASDVIKVGDDFYAVCDNSWAIGKFNKKLKPFSEENFMVGSPFNKKVNEDSQWEAIVHAQGDQFWVVREAVEHDKHFHAHFQLLEFDEKNRSYEIIEECPSEFVMTGGNKGFEGAIGLRDSSGELYMIGLCEGNHCEGGKKGREAGNGMAVLMKKVNDTEKVAGKLKKHTMAGNVDCLWETVKIMQLPKNVKFVDYSAIAIRENKIAVTSQESSQMWLGEIVMEDGHINPKTVEFKKGGKIYDFPTDSNCNPIYCNIEGIDFVDDNAFVAVSDKMKAHGRQDFRCLAKDQSVHVFVLP